MNLRSVLGMVLIAMLIGGAISVHGSLPSFVDLASLLIVCGLVGAGALVSFPVSELVEALAPGRASTPELEARRQVVLHRLADLSVSAGVVGTCIGLVLMLQNLDDPTKIGPAMAVALLTLLYGVVLGELVLRGLATGSSVSSDGAAGASSRRGAVSIYLPLVGALVFLTTLLAMLVAMGD